jgi:hypothetical protein
MEVAARLFRAIHAAFHGHCLKHDDTKLDKTVRQQIFARGSDEVQRVIRDHPTLFERITDRDTACNPQRMSMLWEMFRLRHLVSQGTMTMNDAQAQLVSSNIGGFTTN